MKRSAILLAVWAGAVNAQSSDLVLRGRALTETVTDFCYDVNKPWVDANPIPSRYAWNSEYVQYNDSMAARLHDILAGHQAPPEVTLFLKSFTDIPERERAGLRGLASDLERIDRLGTRADIARLVARANRTHRDPVVGLGSPTPAPFYTEVRSDPSDSRRRLIHILQGGLGLPGSSYYLDGSLQAVREQYRAHVIHVLTLADTSNPEQAASDALEIESALARAQYDLVRLQGAEERARRFRLAQLEVFAPKFDWGTFFNAARLDPKAEVIVPQAGFILSATELMASQPMKKLRAYFRWQLLRRYSMFLPPSFVESALQFGNKTLQGAKDFPTTAQLAETYVPFYLPEALSAEYVKRYVTPEARSTATQIAENVRTSYRERITASAWLSAQSRAEALRKLDTLEIGMLYPDAREQPERVSLKPNDLVGNVMMLNERTYDARVRRLSQPLDRKQWWDSPISTTTR